MHVVPLNDAARLDEIARLDVFKPEVTVLVNRYARWVAEHLGMPVAIVSIVLDDVQYFAGMHGLPSDNWLRELQGTPIEWSFCRYAVEDGAPFVVEDAETHPRTCDNPLVYHDSIRAYLGVPLVSRHGYIIGAFCTISPQVRKFTPNTIRTMEAAAREVMDALEARAISQSA